MPAPGFLDATDAYANKGNVVQDSDPFTRDPNAVHSDVAGTQTIKSHLTFAAQKKIQLFSNDTSGSAARLIELWAGSITDRPSLSFFDFNARHVVAFNCHDTLPAGEGGQQLKQLEVKTLGDPGAPNPNDLRTRMAWPYDVQRGTWGATFTRYFEVNQGENPVLNYPNFAVEDFGLRLRTLDSLGASFVAAQFLAQIAADDSVTVFLDAKNSQTAKGAQIVINRNLNTSLSSGADIFLKKGDGSNTTVLTISPRPATPVMTLGDPFNIAAGTVTGSLIGTAATQKLGFWGATPVVQPAATGTATGFTAGAGTAVNDASTFTGGTGATAYRISDIVKALKNTGFLAA